MNRITETGAHWSSQLTRDLSNLLAIPIDSSTGAFILEDREGIEWTLEFSDDPDLLILHAPLLERARGLCNEELQGWLTMHGQPRLLQGGCVALDQAAGQLRLVHTLHARDVDAYRVNDTLSQLRSLRSHFIQMC